MNIWTKQKKDAAPNVKSVVAAENMADVAIFVMIMNSITDAVIRSFRVISSFAVYHMVNFYVPFIMIIRIWTSIMTCIMTWTIGAG